jgi:hypothetical protein
MPGQQRPLNLLLCQARASCDILREFQSNLTKAGIVAWLYKKKLPLVTPIATKDSIDAYRRKFNSRA